jgi:hypothetical protein
MGSVVAMSEWRGRWRSKEKGRRVWRGAHIRPNIIVELGNRGPSLTKRNVDYQKRRDKV